MTTITLPHGAVHYRDRRTGRRRRRPAGGLRARRPRRRLAVDRRGRRPGRPGHPLDRPRSPARRPPAAGRRARRAVATRRRPAGHQPPRGPRPGRRHARRQRHRRGDLPVPGGHRPLADRPPRAHQLRRLRAVPSRLPAEVHPAAHTAPGRGRGGPGHASHTLPPQRLRLRPLRSPVRRGDDRGVDRATAHRRAGSRRCRAVRPGHRRRRPRRRRHPPRTLHPPGARRVGDRRPVLHARPRHSPRHRLPDASLVEVAGARTFVPLDDPNGVAAEIVSLVPERCRHARSDEGSVTSRRGGAALRR